MSHQRALHLLYSDKPRVEGGYRLRLALECLAREICPDSDDALVIVDGEFGESAVRNRGPVPWVRWAGFGRAYDQRIRLGRLVAGTFPDVRKAYAVFHRGGEAIAAIELPVTS